MSILNSLFSSFCHIVTDADHSAEIVSAEDRRELRDALAETQRQRETVQKYGKAPAPQKENAEEVIDYWGY